MRKFVKAIYLMVAFTTISLMSCGNSSENTSNDSTLVEVDTVVTTDSVRGDSVLEAIIASDTIPMDSLLNR